MAKAFKCDICGAYVDGTPYEAILAPSAFENKTVRFEACKECMHDITATAQQYGGMKDIDELIFGKEK